MQFEYVFVSNTTLGRLEHFSKNLAEVDQQTYEDVPGFESLNNGIQTRTTSYSCSPDSDDYDENSLQSRPLPWVVRVLFESENSLRGEICSATIIDNYWLVTSKKCCLNKDSFKVIFADEMKSKWLFWGKKKQKKCATKQFCSKMHPRNDKEF